MLSGLKAIEKESAIRYVRQSFVVSSSEGDVGEFKLAGGRQSNNPET